MSNPMAKGKLRSEGGDAAAVEVELVIQARQGSAEAFSDLVRLYQRRVVAVAYRLLNNAEDAGDVAQDAFVRAFRKLEQLDDPSRFGPWLMRMVTNLSLNFRRARSTRQAFSLDTDPDRPVEGTNPTTGREMSTTLDDGAGPLPAELQERIGEAINRLPEKQRLALILFSIEGMPQKEVADVLDCTVELVKWNVFQARKKLKEILADYL